MSSGSPSRIPRPSGRPPSGPSLPSPPSLEIATVLAQAGPFDDLKSLVPSFTVSTSDDEGDLEDVPPFPKDHQPPIFIIQGHRAQVPFAVRPGVIALGDIHADEYTARIVLSAPTIPRMNLVMKEALFMNTWVERLTPQRPPRHVPWTSDNPVPRRNWISEGSIFPAETMKSQNGKIRQARVDQRILNGPSKETDPQSPPCTASIIRNHRETAVISKESPGRQAGYNRWSVHVPTSAIKRETASSGPGPSTPIRGQKGTRAQCSSDSPVLGSCSDKTIKQLTSTCRKSSRALPQLGSTINSLAIRRGKKVSGLQLKEVDNMDYPDIPTAFRGSPTVWSPKFDPAVPSPNGKLFTDHGSMLSSLRSQYAALTSGISTPTTHKNKEWQDAFIDSDTDSVSSPSSSRDDEWAFENDLDLDLQGAVDNVSPTPTSSFTPKIAPDKPRISLNFTPDRCSTPTRSPTLPSPQSAIPAVKVSLAPLTGPPRVPLPPRPVLISPSTPPRVKGILKKVKSVRFEDIRGSQDVSLLVAPAPESSTVAKRPSPLRNSFMAPIDGAAPAADATKPANTQPGTGPTALQPKADQKPAIKKKPHMMKSKLVPKGTILSSHRMSEVPILKFVDTNVRQEVPPVPELNAPATSTPGRHNRVASTEKETGQTALARARKRWSTMNENDLRMGVEGTAPKSRLTTPLRNIFKFK
ncbi:hypothetical protein DEU56DRAFT_981670 [Suillus clintonianus]|uniref:uncharacterized protein n=1 Tax=Suillus clintonianus TaxID=1904413 RepID=UPI001B8691E7|nr:uncharacterized protein DEU56DRAFT_981670 [Suillus clintonianus]KAG2132796.1 hypothetical protein DEU56DRAFT_981670 [Suillus clintonianus]